MDGKRSEQYQEVEVKSALPLWAAAAVWVLAALVVPMYRLWQILLVAAVSAAAALAVKKLLPKETKRVAVASDNPALDRMLDALDDAAVRIRADRAEVIAVRPEPAANMGEIAELTDRIRDALEASPEDVSRLVRFVNYYLPTTVKLTGKYVLAIRHGADGTNTAETCAAVESALVQIRDAFRRQLDAMFADDALDVTTDVTVLEEMLKRI